MKFAPPFCPIPGCPSGDPQQAFTWHRRGRYRRACDGRWIPRFHCHSCDRSFSSQTFRSSYRYRKPFLHHLLIQLLCSKVTRRQAARVLGVHRNTVERRFLRFARIGCEFHLSQLEQCRSRGGMIGTFQLDELETFEHHRRLKPITMGVLIERKSYFVVNSCAGTLPPRRPLKDGEASRLAAIEAAHGKRQSQSRACVRDCALALRSILAPEAAIIFQSDKKTTYRSEFRRTFSDRLLIHHVTSSKAVRDYRNVLFPINHTLAMMRDGVSALVRRSWGVSKKLLGLQRHVWLWTCYRNYVRGVTVRTKKTPAQCAGVSDRRFSVRDAFQWRWPLSMIRGQRHSSRPDSYWMLRVNGGESRNSPFDVTPTASR